MAGRLRTVALLASLLTGCSGAAGDQAVRVQATTTSTSTTATTTAPTTTTTTTTTKPPPTTTTPGRPVTQQAYTPFATAGSVVLRHPAARVERIGFHESTSTAPSSWRPCRPPRPRWCSKAGRGTPRAGARPT